MLITYVAIALGSGIATILGSNFSAVGFVLAPCFASLAVAITGLWVALLDAPDYRARADLNAHNERRDRILGMFAERAGGNQPTVIEGEFSVLSDLRKSGAL